MNELMEKFEELSERDRNIVLALIPVVIVLLIIFAVVMPVNAMVEEAEQNVSKNKQAVNLLNKHIGSGAGASSGKRPVNSLSSIVTQTSRQANFSLSRIQEKKKDEVQVWFDSIPFDDMLNWLARIENQYGITSSNVSVSQSSDAGIVRANVKLFVK